MNYTVITNGRGKYTIVNHKDKTYSSPYTNSLHELLARTTHTWDEIFRKVGNTGRTLAGTFNSDYIIFTSDQLPTPDSHPEYLI